MVLHCKNCGQAIYASSKKCNNCGTDVLDSFAFEFNNKKDEAFTAIYENTVAWVESTIRNSINCGNTEAQDIALEIYTKVYLKFDTFNPEKGTFRAWFNKVVKNHIIDYGRKKHLWSQKKSEQSSVNAVLMTDEELAVFSDHKTEPDTVLELKERNRILNIFLEGIPIEQRVCLDMVSEGLKIREIAQYLNIPEGTVKSRIYNARKTLESKEAELRKSGYYLYGLSPIALFIWLLHSDTAMAAKDTDQLLDRIKQQITEENIRKSIHTNNKQNRKTDNPQINLAKDPATFMNKTFISKAIAGVLAFILLFSGIYAAVSEHTKTSTLNIVENTEIDTDGYASVLDNIPKEYQQILSCYQSAISGEKLEKPELLGHNGQGLFVVTGMNIIDENGYLSGYESFEKIYYAYYDLNQDTIPELLISLSTNQNDDMQVWTHDGTSAIEVICADYRYHVSLRADGLIRVFLSGGGYSNALEFYQFDSTGNLTLLDELETNSGENLFGKSKFDIEFAGKIKWSTISQKTSR